MSESPREIDQILPVRLDTGVPHARPRLRALVLGLLLFGSGCAALAAWKTGSFSNGAAGWIALVAGIVLLCPGLFFSSLWTIAWIGTGHPVPLVEIGGSPVRRGETVELRLRQPGPATLLTIEARLECCRLTARIDPATGQEIHSREMLYEGAILKQIERQRIPRGEIEDIEGSFQLPDRNLPPSGSESDSDTERSVVIWRIAVRGIAASRIGFGHYFPFEVSPA